MSREGCAFWHSPEGFRPGNPQPSVFPSKVDRFAFRQRVRSLKIFLSPQTRPGRCGNRRRAASKGFEILTVTPRLQRGDRPRHGHRKRSPKTGFHLEFDRLRRSPKALPRPVLRNFRHRFPNSQDYGLTDVRRRSAQGLPRTAVRFEVRTDDRTRKFGAHEFDARIAWGTSQGKDLGRMEEAPAEVGQAFPLTRRGEGRMTRRPIPSGVGPSRKHPTGSALASGRKRLDAYAARSGRSRGFRIPAPSRGRCGARHPARYALSRFGKAVHDRRFVTENHEQEP